MFQKLTKAFEGNSKNLKIKLIFSNSLNKKLIGVRFSSTEEKQPVDSRSHFTQQSVKKQGYALNNEVYTKYVTRIMIISSFIPPFLKILITIVAIF